MTKSRPDDIMIMGKIIAVSGVARAGKDSWISFASEYLTERGQTCAEFAFANQLKSDLEAFVLEKFGIDIWTDDTEQKTKIRDLMVAYGRIQRVHSNGQYWIDKIRPLVTACPADIIFISDCRYPNDEVDFIHGAGGIVIHISRYSSDWLGTFKDYRDGANDEERKNDPLVKNKADFRFEWPDFGDNKEAGRQLVWEFLNKNKI